jgi:ankyrin repeat protein/signal recognition particle receptor subunit beta
MFIEKYGCVPNVVTDSNQSLLHYACRGGHIDTVMLLIEKYGCDPNVVTISDESPLHYACRYSHIDIVKLLIEKYGCDPNVVTKSNQSLLHYACRGGNIESDIIKYFINKHHLNPLIRDNINHLEPLDYAVYNNQYSIAVYICQNCISSDEMLNPNRIKTTINLIKYILKVGTWARSNEDPSYPLWKTADGDTILQIMGSSKTCIAHMPTAIVSEILHSHNTNHNNIIAHYKPDLRTADGDTILEVVCQSRRAISQISSSVMIKWLSDSTDLMKIVTLEGNTADGNNLLELVCQSEKCLMQISSTIFLKWLTKTVLGSMTMALPDYKTADGDTLLQLILRSEMSISRISSRMLAKLLSNSNKMTISEMKNVNPNWKTVDGAHFPHVLCLSQIENNKVTELMQYYILKNDWNPDISDGEGNTVLHITCQTDKPALVSYLINQAQCNPNKKNSKGSLPVDMVTNLEIINYFCQHDQVSVSSKTITKWLKHPMIDDTTMLCILQSLVDNHKTITKDGSTLLHVVCSTSYDKKSLVEYLLTECQCDPNCLDSKGRVSLQLTSNSEIMKVLIEHGAKMTTDIVFNMISSKHVTESRSIELLALSSRKGTMLWHPTDLNRKGKTALDLAYTRNKPVILNYLLTEAKCDPSANNLLNSLLELTTNLNVAKLLIKHGARVTPKLVLRFEAMEAAPNKGTLLELMLTTWNPDDRDSDGYTALHLACKADRPTTVNLLLSVAHCDPNVKSKNINEECPIQLTSDLRIMKTLIEHGVQLMADVVFKLISMHNTDSRVSELFKLSTRKGTILWNPHVMNSDGYTTLHLACKADSFIIVHYLLSVAHCDPNIKSNCSEEVPLQMTTNPVITKDLIRYGARTSIMYESYKKFLGTNKPLQPPVKVFVVGNPSVGKSTLTAALKIEKWIIAQFFSSRKVSGVDERTVGIVPHELESGYFGRVTLYDFAGHREFYSGHAALLQTAIQSTPPIFLLVVNLSEDDNKIIKNILYWILFLENQCASVTCRPHIILVGSHADALKGANPKDKVKTIMSTLDTKCFTNMEYIGFVAMNCQFHESTGMSELRHLLIKSCQELRMHEPITFNAHCFLIYLLDKFINLTAVTIRTVSETIKNEPPKEGVLEFLPTNFDALYKICLELNDRGHILLLKDRVTVENTYIVIDKQFLLSKISGTVFAPEGFKQYKHLSSNTGVVPLSKFAHCFPESDINILIAFFTHLEFCHEISDQALLRQIAKYHSQTLNSKECYYLFPGLISLEAENDVWEMEPDFNFYFGWILQCTNLEQFLTSRFLQVLLLRLAFSLALESKCDSHDVIGIHRKCSVWKNGIVWGREFGMETLVEVVEDKCVVVMCRFLAPNLEKCLKHRSEVIRTVLECLSRFCPRVSVTESYIDASFPLRYPFDLNLDKAFCTVQALAETIVSDEPSVFLSCGKTVPTERFLSFEPYTEIELPTLQELWDDHNENKIISDSFLLEFASRKLNWFAKLFSDSAKIPSSKDDLYYELLKWKDNKMTYKQFRQKLDQYSVFAGRNVLVSIIKLTQNFAVLLLTIIYHNNRILLDIGMNHHHQKKDKRNHELKKTKIYFLH